MNNTDIGTKIISKKGLNILLFVSKAVKFVNEVQRLDIVIGSLETRHCIDEVFSSLETQCSSEKYSLSSVCL